MVQLMRLFVGLDALPGTLEAFDDLRVVQKLGEG